MEVDEINDNEDGWINQLINGCGRRINRIHPQNPQLLPELAAIVNSSLNDIQVTLAFQSRIPQ